jgi:hypothetical protein
MPRTKKPIHFEPLTGEDAYEQLEFYARGFANNKYNCLVVVGPPGRLKSSIIERATQGHARLISGNGTHFEVFCELQRHINENIIIDDADGLYGSDDGRRLLNQVTNPKKPTLVSHHSKSAEALGLQKEFRTSSRVFIVDNAWGSNSNERLEAMEDRSRLFLFDPPPVAIHRRMGLVDWFHDTEIIDFVGEHLYFINYEDAGRGKGLSVRLYVKALEAKEAGEDWRDYILKQYVKGPDKDLLAIYSDPYFQGRSVEERCQAFMTRSGKSRSTFYDHKRQLLARLINSGANMSLLGKLTLEKDEQPQQPKAPTPEIRCSVCGSEEVVAGGILGKPYLCGEHFEMD